ncbi:hypothetical protein GS479_24545 [Rhodococcus hoagii]|nr:hypothetical protein [Prescottella equi]
MAHVWPLVVDGLAVVATAAVMRLHASRVYAWSLLAAATAVSIVAGAAAHLLPAGPLPGGRARPSQSSRRSASSSRHTSPYSCDATRPVRRRRHRWQPLPWRPRRSSPPRLFPRMQPLPLTSTTRPDASEPVRDALFDVPATGKRRRL